MDLSKTYISWAKENLRLNGFLDDRRQDGHQLIASDVGDFLDNHPAGERYDLVVFDPPTYSRSKKTDRDWNVQTDAIPMLQKLLPLVRKGGVIFFSNNFRRFKFEPSETGCLRVPRNLKTDRARRLSQSPHPPMLANRSVSDYCVDKTEDRESSPWVTPDFLGVSLATRSA